MAGVKLSALTIQETTPLVADRLYIVNDPSGTAESRYVEFQDLLLGNRFYATSGVFSLYRAQGTEAAKTAITSGLTIGEYRFVSYNGSSWVATSKIIGTSTELHSGTASGSDLKFYTVPDTTIIQTLALTLGQDQFAEFAGNVGIGYDDTSTSALAVNGNMSIGDDDPYSSSTRLTVKCSNNDTTSNGLVITDSSGNDVIIVNDSSITIGDSLDSANLLIYGRFTMNSALPQIFSGTLGSGNNITLPYSGSSNCFVFNQTGLQVRFTLTAGEVNFTKNTLSFGDAASLNREYIYEVSGGDVYIGMGPSSSISRDVVLKASDGLTASHEGKNCSIIAGDAFATSADDGGHILIDSGAGDGIGANGMILIGETNGNVGIGYGVGATLTAKLQINGDIRQKVYTYSITDSTPSDSEITDSIGVNASTAGSGYNFFLKDSSGTGNVYYIISDGSGWYYEEMTLATGGTTTPS